VHFFNNFFVYHFMTLVTSAPQPRLLILLNEVNPAAPESILVALRYAVTAAAMDVAVELHAVGSSAALLRHGVASPAVLEQLRQAVELEVAIFVCPVALSEQGMQTDDLIAEVTGVRGAASLLVAGLAPGARFMNF
jgi:predicted peroxiredoxin